MARDNAAPHLPRRHIISGAADAKDPQDMVRTWHALLPWQRGSSRSDRYGNGRGIATWRIACARGDPSPRAIESGTSCGGDRTRPCGAGCRCALVPAAAARHVAGYRRCGTDEAAGAGRARGTRRFFARFSMDLPVQMDTAYSIFNDNRRSSTAGREAATCAVDPHATQNRCSASERRSLEYVNIRIACADEHARQLLAAAA